MTEEQKKMIENSREYRELMLSDPYRPAYHFAIPDDDGRPGDPNGAFYADGRYHLMYLYRRRSTNAFHWGHISSRDLLHWRAHPDAIGGFGFTPGEGSVKVNISEDLLKKIPEDLRESTIALLAEDPRPGYQHDPERIYRMAYADFEIHFTVKDDTLTVTGIIK